MKIFYQIFLLVVCIGLFKKANAQDPHYSQFFSSPLSLSPAFTGKFDGSYRVALNHRNQWPTINNAFVTTSASFDCKAFAKSIADNDMIGLGISALTDYSANSAVKQNFISGSIAYHKGLDDDGLHQISLGFQATYANMFINPNVLNFEDQFTLNGFSRPTSESFGGSTLQNNYTDFNVGLLFTGSNYQKFNYYAGVSMYHMNKPKLDFTGNILTLAPRMSLHAGANFGVGEFNTLHVSLLHSRQADASESLAGAALQIPVNPQDYSPVSIYAGSWYRLNDALIPYAAIEFNNMRIGLSYDVNVSYLKTASQKMGGFELSLIYTHQPNTDKPLNCPKF